MNRYRTISSILIVIVVLTGLVVMPQQTAHADDCLTGPNVPGCKFGLPAGQYDGLLGQMNANPAPNMTSIGVDMTEVHRYSFYKWRERDVTFYNAPNGSPMGKIDAGFSYVTIMDSSGDWAEVSDGQWVPMSALVRTYASGFAGALVNGPLPFPVAWVNTGMYTSSVPGGAPNMAMPPVPKFSRVYIYAAVTIGQWEWYLIGPGRWIEQRKVGRVLPTPRPGGVSGRWVSVDLYEQVLIAYDNDQMVFTTLISSGLPNWWTNQGLFKIWARLTSDKMTGAMGQTDYYNLPRVPYVMYFDHDISLHGTYWHDSFGFQHSHGCVNMSIADSHWLFDWTSGSDGWVYVWRSRA